MFHRDLAALSGKWSCGLEAGRRRVAAFTMVEIALSLAVIAFALVAIIGVLPTGLRAQKDNREDTILNQDGLLLLEAIRSQSLHLDYLTNYFDLITVSNNRGGVIVSTNGMGGTLTNGQMIMELLSVPKYVTEPDGRILTNHVTAHVRAISGSAARPPRTEKEFAFAYRLKSEIIPLVTIAPEFTNFLASGLSPAEVTSRSNLWRLARHQQENFNEVRLTLQGPLIRRGQNLEVTGTPRTFRTLFSGCRSDSNHIIQNYFRQKQ